jgi:hypothetical protein
MAVCWHYRLRIVFTGGHLYQGFVSLGGADRKLRTSLTN